MNELPAANADYRARIYERYASNFQSAPQMFEVEASRRWGKAYRHYLRGWLPARRPLVSWTSPAGEESSCSSISTPLTPTSTAWT